MGNNGASPPSSALQLNVDILFKKVTSFYNVSISHVLKQSISSYTTKHLFRHFIFHANARLISSIYVGRQEDARHVCMSCIFAKETRGGGYFRDLPGDGSPLQSVLESMDDLRAGREAPFRLLRMTNNKHRRSLFS